MLILARLTARTARINRTTETAVVDAGPAAIESAYFRFTVLRVFLIANEP